MLFNFYILSYYNMHKIQVYRNFSQNELMRRLRLLSQLKSDWRKWKLDFEHNHDRYRHGAAFFKKSFSFSSNFIFDAILLQNYERGSSFWPGTSIKIYGVHVKIVCYFLPHNFILMSLPLNFHSFAILKLSGHHYEMIVNFCENGINFMKTYQQQYEQRKMIQVIFFWIRTVYFLEDFEIENS